MSLILLMYNKTGALLLLMHVLTIMIMQWQLQRRLNWHIR